jgi:hypothetical protein
MDGRDGEELEEEDDHVSYIERFKRLWRNERCAPALLPHQEELIEKLKADLEAQVRPRPRACLCAHRGCAVVLEPKLTEWSVDGRKKTSR